MKNRISNRMFMLILAVLLLTACLAVTLLACNPSKTDDDSPRTAEDLLNAFDPDFLNDVLPHVYGYAYAQAAIKVKIDATGDPLFPDIIGIIGLFCMQSDRPTSWYYICNSEKSANDFAQNNPLPKGGNISLPYKNVVLYQTQPQNVDNIKACEYQQSAIDENEISFINSALSSKIKRSSAISLEISALNASSYGIELECTPTIGNCFEKYCINKNGYLDDSHWIEPDYTFEQLYTRDSYIDAESNRIYLKQKPMMLFSKTNNGEAYAVSKYYYDSETVSAEIPTSYNGKPVTAIVSQAFAYCTGLTDVTIPNSITQLMGFSFLGCTSLNSINIPASVTHIAPDVFCKCTSLSVLTVESGNPKYHSAGNCIIETQSKTLIAGCKTSEIPSDGSVLIIETEAFSECPGLTHIYIPNGVKSINPAAFFHCSNLTEILISDSVNDIGYMAFSYSIKLNDIEFQGTKAQWNSINKQTGWDENTGAFKVSCSDGDLDKDGNEI